jgi:hypothetical protein
MFGLFTGFDLQVETATVGERERERERERGQKLYLFHFGLIKGDVGRNGFRLHLRSSETSTVGSGSGRVEREESGGQPGRMENYRFKGYRGLCA